MDKDPKYKVIDKDGHSLFETDKKNEAIEYYKADLTACGFISPKLMRIPKRKKWAMSSN